MSNEVAILLASAIGVFGALAGAFVGPFFQRKHEHWRAEREDNAILRGKAEELFDELDRINLGSHQSSMAAIKALNNKDAEAVPIPDLGKVRAIASVYFPGCQPLIDAYEAKRSSTTKSIIQRIVEENEKHGPNPDLIRAMTFMTVTEQQSAASELAKQIREHISTIIPRFE